MRVKKGLAYLLTTAMVIGTMVGVPAKGSVVEAASVTLGNNIVVTGGTQGTDYSYNGDTKTLSILTSTPLELSSNSKEVTGSIYIGNSSAPDVYLTLNGLCVYCDTGAGLKIEDDYTGDVKLTLKGNNTRKQYNYFASDAGAGIQKNTTKSDVGELVIQGTGDLKVESAGSDTLGCAAIGGSKGYDTANIRIEGGIITAKSYSYGAAIGGGHCGDGNSITINGGAVTATATGYAAAIGGGYMGVAQDLVIGGGTITATGGTDSAAIGAGTGYDWLSEATDADRGKNTDITITGGYVTATGTSQFAPGIGSGKKDESKDSNTVTKVAIEGGTIVATGGVSAPGIGAGECAGTNVYIKGGSIKATAGSKASTDKYDADAIGLGNNQKVKNAGMTNPKYSNVLAYSEENPTAVSLKPYTLLDAAAFISGEKVLVFADANGSTYSYGMNGVTPIDGVLYLYLRPEITSITEKTTTYVEENAADILLKYNDSETLLDWYKGDVKVSADGYEISDSPTSGFATSYTFSTAGSGSISKTLYFKNVEWNKVLSTNRNVSVKIDNTAPAGNITIDGQLYNSLNEDGSVKICHLESNVAKMTAWDTGGSGVNNANIKYATSSQFLTDENTISNLSWKSGTECSLASGQALYVRIEDNVGNIRYISTPIVRDDTTAPSYNIQEGTKTSSSISYTMTFADANSNSINYAYALLKQGETAPASWDELVAIGTSGTTTGTVSKTFSGLTPNTPYKLYVMANDGMKQLSGDANPNYTTMITREITTSKATASVSSQTYPVKSGVQTEYTYDLKNMLIASGLDTSLMGTITYTAVPDSGEILSTTNKLLNGSNNSTMTIPVKSSFDVGKTQNIKITIESTNYETIETTLVVKSISKTPVTLSGITRKNAVYNGEKQSGYTGTIQWKDGNGNVTVSGTTVEYKGINGTTHSNPAEIPSNAGDYQVTFTVANSDASYEGSATYNFTIEKADLTNAMANTAWYINGTKISGSSASVIVGPQYEVEVGDYSDMVTPTITGDNSESEVGSYEAYASFAFTDSSFANNYNLPESMTLYWEIGDKITPNMSSVSWIYKQGTTQEAYVENVTKLVENGSPYIIEVTGLPEGVQATYNDGCTKTKAGEYTATVTFTVTDESKYKTPSPSTMTLNWSIAEKENNSGETSGNGGSEAGGGVTDDETGDETGGETGGQTGDTTGGETGDTTGGETGSTTGSETGGTTGSETPAIVLPATGSTVVDGTNNYTVTTASETGGTVEYAGPTNKNIKKVVIPSSIVIDGQTYQVDSIAKNALNGCKKLTSVTIPNGVKTIGVNAFKGCVKLTKIKIPNSVTNIGSNAFNGCKKLKTVTISGSAKLTKFGDKAFYKCTSLTKITIPKNVTTIGKSTFEGCKSLKTITIKSKKLKKVGSKAIKNIHKKATIKCPGKKYVTKYKKLFKSKTGYKKTMKIK